jgi:DNA-binding MarR family transcriptional regulator
MPDTNTPEMIRELLGSVQVFSWAVRNVLEEKLLSETARGRLTFSRFKLLKLVAFTDSHTIGDVAAFLGVSNTAASKAVDKLVRRRLLRRTEGHTDRRASELSLTGEGRRLLSAYEAARDQKLTEIFSACAPEQLCGTVAILDRLSANMMDHSANPQELCFQCGIYFREKCLLRELVRRTCFYQKHKVRKATESAVDSAGGTGTQVYRSLRDTPK